jgi:hypothetical protein
MSNYGRNGEFRRPPTAQMRDGRYATKVTDPAIPNFAPVVVDLPAGENSMLMQVVKLAPADTPRAFAADKGIALIEHIPATGYAGLDPLLTTYADLGTIPPGEAIQLIHGGGEQVKVLLRNTVARNFLGIRSYPGRVMVAGLGATPTLQAGDFLTPGAGNDTAGYWKETSTAANAWLQIVRVDLTRAEVEALMLI